MTSLMNMDKQDDVATGHKSKIWMAVCLREWHDLLR